MAEMGALAATLWLAVGYLALGIAGHVPRRRPSPALHGHSGALCIPVSWGAGHRVSCPAYAIGQGDGIALEFWAGADDLMTGLSPA